MRQGSRRYKAGMFSWLLPLPLWAQEPGTPSESDPWSEFIEGLKKLIPGTLEDGFLESLKEDQGFLLEGLLALPVVIGTAYLVTRLLRWLIAKAADRSNRHRVQWLRTYPILRLLVWGIALLYLLQLFMGQHWDIMLVLLALLIGYASKEGLSDLLSGIWMTVERPFSVGDRIASSGYYGEVKNIGLRATTLQTLDDSSVAIPNSALLGQPISNANSGANYCMVVIDFWLPIRVDTERASRIAYEATVSSPYLNLDQPLIVLVTDHFKDKPATLLKVKAYVLANQYEKLLESNVTEAAKAAFREAGLYEGW